jgi:hypothetical protein
MTDLAETAVITLQAAMTDPDTSPGVKVRAALGVLTQWRDFIEFADETQTAISWEQRSKSEVDRILAGLYG